MTDTDTREQAPASLNTGNPRVAGTDRTMWGVSTLRLYGSPRRPQLHAETPMRGTCAFNIAPDDLVRFCREVLAFMGEASGVAGLPAWRPVRAGSGPRPWYLTRYSGEHDMRVPDADRCHYSKRGGLVRYASQEAAQLAADRLNAS